MKKSTALLLAAALLAPAAVAAHPGANSWDGCHYCKTNCPKWGYTYNTRHCKSPKLKPQFGVPDPKVYGKRK